MTARLHRLRDLAIRRAVRFTRHEGPGHGNTVLVIQPDHLGDVLLSQPAVSHIRQRFPERRIVGVVGPWSERIARRTWSVDEIVTFPFPAFDRARPSGSVLSPYTMLSDAAELLHPLEPGTVFVLRPDDWWSAWLASMLTDDIVAAEDSRMDPFVAAQVDLAPFAHATQRALAIAHGPGSPADSSLWTPEHFPLSLPANDLARAHAARKLAAAGIDGGFVVVHPGAGAEVKTWPSGRWRAVIERLASTGISIVVTGSPQEQETARELTRDIDRAVCLAGETGLDDLVEVLRLAVVVAGPDSGPLHLAVACGTPTVHLFGPSEPRKFGPWGPPERHRVISAGWTCQRCGDLSAARRSGCGCMLALEVDTVTEAIEEARGRHAAV